MITFKDIEKNEEIRTYIQKGNELLGVLGFTEHSLVHASLTAKRCSYVMESLGYGVREIETAKIAGYIHDIGNVVNRADHAQSGALMAFNILTRLGMEPDETADIVSAIGNHDEGTGWSVNPISAALILADKSDVRRSRVRNTLVSSFDIHDRVNYAVEQTELICDKDKNAITLQMDIDTDICPVMDYFEIFLGRMMMCRRAADFFDMRFSLIINKAKMI